MAEPFRLLELAIDCSSRSGGCVPSADLGVDRVPQVLHVLVPPLVEV